jgi:hypothetical protein
MRWNRKRDPLNDLAATTINTETQTSIHKRHHKYKMLLFTFSRIVLSLLLDGSAGHGHQTISVFHKRLSQQFKQEVNYGLAEPYPVPTPPYKYRPLIGVAPLWCAKPIKRDHQLSRLQRSLKTLAQELWHVKMDTQDLVNDNSSRPSTKLK